MDRRHAAGGYLAVDGVAADRAGDVLSRNSRGADGHWKVRVSSPAWRRASFQSNETNTVLVCPSGRTVHGLN